MPAAVTYSALPRSFTLQDACKEVATEARWRTICTGLSYGVDAIQRLLPDDAAQWNDPTQELSFLHPEEARAYLQGRTLAYALVADALLWLEQNHWQAIVRRRGSVFGETISYHLLRQLELKIDDIDITNDETEYVDLHFKATTADIFASMEQAIREAASRLDPVYDNLDDLRFEVQRMSGIEVNKTSFEETARRCDLHLKWFSRGRKKGRPQIY